LRDQNKTLIRRKLK